MSEQILTALKNKLDELSSYGELDVETRRNFLKEELQFYVLNFIYHHPEYSKWIMYGGSALRIVHGLDRMSVDLDFEVPYEITGKFLNKLKREIRDYFKNTYGAKSDFLTIKIVTNRGLLLKFYMGEDLLSDYPSKQIHVKIDLNSFVAPETVHEHRPINQGQFSFVIITYNMSALMASKIAAILLRNARGVGKAIYKEKGRDIYDLLWYMNKKVVPDFDYLSAKGIDVNDARTLFDKLTFRMNKVNNENLKQDLTPLFINRIYIENWLKNWLVSYFQLLNEYKINTVTVLTRIQIHQHFHTDNFSFTYSYNTEEGRLVKIRYIISDYWIDFNEGDLNIEIDKKLEDKINFSSDGWSSQPLQKDKLKQYATLFYNKTGSYLKKTNKVVLGDNMITKVIRMTADNLNQKEQIVLNRSALFSCSLDDLLR